MSYSTPMRFAEALIPFANEFTLPDGTRLACLDSAGDCAGDPVLLVHGLQDEADTWRHIFTPLTRMRRIVAPDLPGFGRSDKARRRYDMQLFTGSILALLDALHIERAHLVGSSLGAMICEFIALHHPQRAASLTLIDGTLIITRPPPTPPGAILRMLFADYFDRRFFNALRRAPDDAYATLQPYYANLSGLPAADRQFLFQRVNERVWDEGQRRAALSVRATLTPFLLRNGARMRAIAARSTVPTTIIWGARDHILSSANGRTRADLQHTARYVEINDAGHLPHQENPGAVLDALSHQIDRS